MSVLTAATAGEDIDPVLQAISQENVRIVLYFFSVDYKKLNIEATIHQWFPEAVCLGSSMIGGWGPNGPMEKGFTAMSLSSDEVETVVSSFREGVKAHPRQTAREIVEDIAHQLPEGEVNPADYIGIVLIDGLSLGELLMKEFTTAKKFTFPIVGGAAADELTFTETLVAHNSRMSSDGAAVAVMKMKVPFFYDHFVHYLPTGKEFLITRADPQRRIVWEINHMPAADYYAKLLNLPGPKAIDHIHFSRNPLGVVIGDRVYTRSPNAVIDGKGLQFYCFIEAGTKMQLLKQGDILENARDALRKAEDYVYPIQGVVLFNCVLRYLEMKEDGKLESFHQIFSSLPYIGFNTYGEELFTHHNQTLTALFIGR
ncbi:FIST signal transduction protein [Sediminispirochaeta bajacaliforniensis]|uniref:FIST signal transduction protein n=1 Tax=Sediminispirochaeta bajacaliforniensis TaxID=148 RepID=UPI00036678ED|nr:FIST N-terminal domain-containing protein [Sediminispirochaeta bajacaliforniensis]